MEFTRSREQEQLLELEEEKHRAATARLVHAAQGYLLANVGAQGDGSTYVTDAATLEEVVASSGHKRCEALAQWLTPPDLDDVVLERYRANRCGYCACPFRNRNVARQDADGSTAESAVVPADAAGPFTAHKTPAEIREKLLKLRAHRAAKAGAPLAAGEDPDAPGAAIEDSVPVTPKRRIVRDPATGRGRIVDAQEATEFCCHVCYFANCSMREAMDQTPSHLRPRVLPGLLQALKVFRVEFAEASSSAVQAKELSEAEESLAAMKLGDLEDVKIVDRGLAMNRTPTSEALEDNSGPPASSRDQSASNSNNGTHNQNATDSSSTRTVHKHPTRRRPKKARMQETPASLTHGTSPSGAAVLELDISTNADTKQLEGELKVVADGDDSLDRTLPTVPVSEATQRLVEEDVDDDAGADLTDFLDMEAISRAPDLSPFATIYMFLESACSQETRALFQACKGVAADAPEPQGTAVGEDLQSIPVGIGSISLDERDDQVARTSAMTQRFDMVLPSFLREINLQFSPLGGILASVGQTFRIHGPLPTFNMSQWRAIVTALVTALAHLAQRNAKIHDGASCARLHAVPDSLQAVLAAERQAAFDGWILRQCCLDRDKFQCLVDIFLTS